MELSQINITPLKKALKALGVALAQPKNEFTRDATIQRFEYSYELCWKTLRRYLAINSGIKEYNIKNIFREAFRQQLLGDVEAWFAYHEARNLTTHTYNENTAEATYLVAKQFFQEANQLVTLLEKNISDLLS